VEGKESKRRKLRVSGGGAVLARDGEDAAGFSLSLVGWARLVDSRAGLHK